jgi:hypothetical protein
MKYLYAFLLPFALVLGGCDVGMAHLAGRASEEWNRTYSLKPGGELRIANTNGKIDVEPSGGTEGLVRAEKIARAATDAGAQELLPRIEIKEEVSPERVSIQTGKWEGFLIGAGFEVRYHVKAPKGVLVNVTNTNGQIALTDLDGKVTAHTTNGGVTGKGLTGAVEARTTNGGVVLDFASVGKEPISAKTTNGGVSISLPQDAKADLSATWTNGGMQVSPDLKLDVVEKSKRRFEGRMNGGGPTIELHTTNGGIRLKSRSINAEDPEGDNPDAAGKPERLKSLRERGQSH